MHTLMLYWLSKLPRPSVLNPSSCQQSAASEHRSRMQKRRATKSHRTVRQGAGPPSLGTARFDHAGGRGVRDRGPVHHT